MDLSNQVHVESLEALERLATQLMSASGRIDELCDQSLRGAGARLEIANAEFEDAVSQLNNAEGEVSRCESDVTECESSAIADNGDGDDDDGVSADDSGWSDAMSSALDALALVKEELACAKAGLEAARVNMTRAEHAQEAIAAGVFTARQHLEHHLGAGIAFLHQKIAQLREYLLGAPELAGASTAGAASYVRAWLGWSPPDHARIRPSLLLARFSLPVPALEDLTRRWASEDPSFARQLRTLRERHSRAGNPEELEAIRRASRRGASGRLGELIAENALRPLARSIELQRRTNTDDNTHVTISDIVLRGLRSPIDWGKLQIPSGADAGVEIKCGGPAYLKQQLTHMTRQVSGHHMEHASFCFLSRDFSKLDRGSKQEIARALGKKRARIFALLPEKSTLDFLVWKQITRI